MAQQHIEQFGGSQVIDENIAVGYWDEAPTDFSPARKQIATVTFKCRKSGESVLVNRMLHHFLSPQRRQGRQVLYESFAFFASLR